MATSARAALAGAGGGVVLAWADFGASWLWLPQPTERLWLALRLVGLLASLGALLGAGVVGLDRLARPLLVRRFGRARLRAAAPLPALLVISPALIGLSGAALGGGRASRLPLWEAWVAAGAIGSAALAYVGMRLIRWIAWRGLRRGARVRLAGAAASLGAAWGLSAADRLLYPRHYDALHGALTACAWVAAALAIWLSLPRGAFAAAGRSLAAPRAAPSMRLASVLLPSVLLASVLLSLPHDHDGRAALLSPRASHARSVMLAGAPVLYAWPRGGASADAVARARRRRARSMAASAEGPSWPEAHLVLVTIDALRADHLGAYGYRRAISPTLDQLASQGVLFERAWTPTPRSSYALCSLMTGVALQPRLARGGDVRAPTLAERLGEGGFYTAGFYPDAIFFHDGERLRGYRERELGFDRRDAENRAAEALTSAALAELEDVRRRGEPRTFLWVHYFDVHEPYRERSLGDAPVDRYDGEIRNVDRALSRLLAGLARLSRDVVLVVSADHGEEHGDHGGRFHGDSLYEEQLRVPLLVVAPGLPPRRVAAPVSLLDLASTLYPMLAVERPAGLEGADLRPLMTGAEPPPRAIRATEEGMRAVLRWPDKLIENDRLGTVELYDLSSDPGERRSLADTHPDRLDALRAELAAFD